MIYSAPLFNQFVERCEVNTSSQILCRSPMVDSSVWGSKVTVEFLLDNLRFDFSSLNDQTFSYEANPVLRPLNQQDPLKVYRYNPGSFIQLEVGFKAESVSTMSDSESELNLCRPVE